MWWVWLTAKLPSPVGEQQDAVAGGPALGEVEPGGVAREQLVVLELVSLVAAVELEGPPAVLGALGPAGVVHHPVQRNELRHHELCHDRSLLSSMPAPRRPSASYTNGFGHFRQQGR